MDVNAFTDKAKNLVVNYYNENAEKTDNFFLTEDSVYIVWFCKTLQNWKALVSTTCNDGMFYEITYNGDKHVSYIDAYKKWKNVAVIDLEEKQ